MRAARALRGRAEAPRGRAEAPRGRAGAPRGRAGALSSAGLGTARVRCAQLLREAGARVRPWRRWRLGECRGWLFAPRTCEFWLWPSLIGFFPFFSRFSLCREKRQGGGSWGVAEVLCGARGGLVQHEQLEPLRSQHTRGFLQSCGHTV